MEPVQIMEVIVPAVGPTTFVLASKVCGCEQVLSASILVQQTLVSAFVTAARVEFELIPKSCVIWRVNPFAAGDGNINFQGEYSVSRIATQRNAGEEHFEVFLKKGDEPEKAYNISDRMLQQILSAVFAACPNGGPVPCLPFYVSFVAEEVAMVRLVLN